MCCRLPKAFSSTARREKSKSAASSSVRFGKRFNVSRIGRLPIAVPDGVKIALADHTVKVEGPKGKLETTVPSEIQVQVDGKVVRVTRSADERNLKALHGLARKLIANMVEGVSKGFTRVLEINGVGYRAEVRGSDLHIALGYSH